MVFTESQGSNVPRPDTAISRRAAHGPKSLAECGSFATLAKRAGALEALDRALRQTLPSPLREEVRFANLRHGRLHFLANTPAWASRLRLMQTQILASAAAIGVSATSVSIKVVVADPAPPEPVPPRVLSPAAARHLRAAAAGLADSGLKKLFLDLAGLADTGSSSAPAIKPARAK